MSIHRLNTRICQSMLMHETEVSRTPPFHFLAHVWFPRPVSEVVTEAQMTYRCVICSKQVSKNVYYCSKHDWHLCWDDVRKATLTNKLTCPKCGEEVHRVD